jgi:phage terminase large subunit-like protein
MAYLIDWKKIQKMKPEKREQLLDDLYSIIQGAEANPLLFFHPYPKQHDFLLSKKHWKWFLGGNRAGKTITCCVDDIIQACDEDVIPEHLLPYKHKTPPYRWRIVAMDFDQIELVVYEELKRWIPPAQLDGGTWKTAYNRERRTLRFKNGSICQFKTYEQAAFNHGGASLDRVHFDEEPPEDIYKENRARIIDNNGDIIISMTPVHGMSWMYDKYYVPYTKHQLTHCFVQLVDMDDNPYINETAKKEALAEYSPEEREARKTGRFIALHGLVYPHFDHVIPEQDVHNLVNTVYVGIDPGIRNMAAVLFIMHTPDDSLVVFHEICAQGKTVAEVCHEIKVYCAVKNIRPKWYIIDPSARNVQHNTGRSLQQEYHDYGITAFPGQNDVRAGINRVAVRLEHKKLYVMANCVNTIDEFRKYRWSKPPRGSENDPKEAPVKRDDHLLDALRYVVMARPYLTPAEKVDTPINPLTDEPLTGADLAAWKDRRRGKRQAKPAFLY